MRDQCGWDGAAYDNWLFSQAEEYMSWNEGCDDSDSCECGECEARRYAEYVEAQADAQYEEWRLRLWLE